MRKQHTLEQQNASSKGNLERESSRLADVHSPVSSRVTATEQFPKKKIRQTDDSPSVAEADDVQSSEYAADADQPVLVAQLDTVPVSGGSAASGADLKLAFADGGESVHDAAPSVSAGASDSFNGWWLGAGLVAAAVGGGIAAASGGSGGSSAPAATTVSGTVTDGPIQGARIYYDVNGNGTYDAGTDTAVLDANGDQVVTDADGNFSFSTTSNPATIRLVASGGIDTVTGEAVTVDFAAPAGYTQINPITSAIAAYMEANPEYTVADAETAVKTALGLPDLDYSAVNLFDPPAEISAADVLAAQKAAAILATTAIVIEQSGADADAFQYVAANMGTGGNTEVLVAAVSADPSVTGTDAATQLNNTVTAINEADTVDAIGEAVTTVFFAEPPVLGDYTVTLNENSANGTVVATVSASDSDGDTLSYAITAGNTGGAFAINSATGAITVADVSQLNFEASTSFSLTIEASDGTLTDTGTVTINLNDINDNTPVITSGDTGSVAENAATSTVIYDAAATDADAGSTITYSLKPQVADYSLINIDSSTGEVRLNNPANYEGKASYSFTVIASDGTNSSEQAVTVSVTNVNETISITSNGGGASASVTIAENVTSVTTVTATDIDAGDSKTFSITGGADQALFAIDSASGVLTFLAARDFESPADAGGNNVYDVQVTVTDTGGLTDVQTLAVTVTNLNEHFVAERTGVWLDVDADGFRDADETTAADFTETGNVDLAAIPAVIHFNNMPNGDISLAGFGADDLIEIDVQAFIDNGHNALQMLTRPNMMTLDEFTGYTAGTTTNTSHSLAVNTYVALSNVVPPLTISRQTGTQYFAGNLYPGATSALSAVANLEARSNSAFTQRSLRFSLWSTSASAAMQATGLPTDLTLQEMVDFVNVPLPPATVHVIVERDGAVIDIDGDGVRDDGENRLAQFGAGGTADLADQSVVIHFNNVAYRALDLTGFGTDDKIQIDVRALRDNGILNYDAANAGLASFAFEGLGLAGYYFSRESSTLLGSITTHFTWIRVNHESASRVDFSGDSHGLFGITFNYINTSVNSRTQGLIAYWGDAENALNDVTNLFPSYIATPTNNNAEVLTHLNANHYQGLVEFVWPVDVVVDSTGVWIDANADGYLDPEETTPADVAADLASSPVTIHFNGIPATPLDFSGFGSDDLVVIDVDALRYGSPSNLRFMQSSYTTSTWPDSAGFSGVSMNTTSGLAAVFVQGGTLKFGHTTPRVEASNTRYFFTATGSLEGAIAINADALANNLDQVIFVTANAGPM